MHGLFGGPKRQVFNKAYVHLLPEKPATIKCEACRIRNLSLCDAILPSELQELDELSSEIEFGANKNIFDQDELADAVFNIVSGVVRLSKLSADGRRQIVGFALPGDFLGLSMTKHNVLSAESVTLTRACRFPSVAFSELLQKKPHVLRRLHSITSDQLTLVQYQMVALNRNTVEQRMATFILTMRDRLRRTIGESNELPLPMTRRDIGDFLGMTIETASREMSKLAKAGVILLKSNGVSIIDEGRLKRLAFG